MLEITTTQKARKFLLIGLFGALFTGFGKYVKQEDLI